ncbi:MAG: DinB family protein [Caulobacterales bacterium]
MPNAFLISLFEHKAWCNQRLVEALRAAPADADRRQMAVVLFTLDHTSIVDQIFKAHLSGEAPGFSAVVADQLPVLGRLAATLAQTDAWYLDYVRAASPADLETVVEFTFVGDGDEGRMTKSQMLAHVITHGASHRGAIGKVLEGLKLVGASDMVTTFQRQRMAVD